LDPSRARENSGGARPMNLGQAVSYTHHFCAASQNLRSRQADCQTLLTALELLELKPFDSGTRPARSNML